jgi:hypothetical protein
MSGTLLVNARLLNEGLRFVDGRIHDLGSGLTARARIATTWVNGGLGWDGSALVGDPAGQRLQFDR